MPTIAYARIHIYFIYFFRFLTRKSIKISSSLHFFSIWGFLSRTNYLPLIWLGWLVGWQQHFESFAVHFGLFWGMRGERAIGANIYIGNKRPTRHTHSCCCNILTVAHAIKSNKLYRFGSFRNGCCCVYFRFIFGRCASILALFFWSFVVSAFAGIGIFDVKQDQRRHHGFGILYHIRTTGFMAVIKI